MPRLVTFSATVLIAAILVACRADDGAGGARVAVSPAASPSPAATVARSPHGDEARRITLTELRAALDKGEAIVVDVRDAAEYAAGHIKGSRSIPEAEIGARAGELPRDKMVVTYCA